MRLMGIAVLLAFLPLTAALADVVINEILYNAPDDRDSMQWIEFYNTGAESVDLSDWSLDQGKVFVFPAGTRIPARGYLVVALDPDAFRKIYDLPAIGPLKRPLKRGSERLELRDARRNRVDVARYKDEAPWPVSADGYSASVERICPSAPGEEPENWAGSPLPPDAPRPAGTPGKPNASFSPALPPVFLAVSAGPEAPAPGQPLQVEAELKHAGALREVALLYRVVAGGAEGKEVSLPMVRDAARERYRASIPAQPAGTLVRYRIRAVGTDGARRLYPAEHDLRPTLSAYVQEKPEPAKIPFGIIIRTRPDPAESEGVDPLAPPRFGGPRFFRGEGPGGPRPPRPPGAPGRPGEGEGERPAPQPGGAAGTGRRALDGARGRAVQSRPRIGAPAPNPPGGFGRGRPGEGGPPGGFMRFFQRQPDVPRSPRGSSAFVYVDPRTGKSALFDHIHVASRARGPMYRGYKVFFHKDRALNGLRSVNLVMEGDESGMMVEALAYDLYHRAGNAAPLSEFIRVWLDGRMIGYHLMVERPSRSFLRRNNLNDEGNLYKLIWYGRDLVDKHEKKTHVQSGHEDLLALVDRLEKTRGDEEWELIRQSFNVDQVATYFAVNMILSHWDGFFNNYFAYHDTGGTKRWEIYPWDQDSTWGLRASFRGDGEVFFNMPLTYGMEGDRPPGVPDHSVRNGEFGGFGSGSPFARGAPGWWRPPGYFSGPLLANPQFRNVFLTRTKEILDRFYTQEIYFPLIDQLADRVREDAILRARAMGRDPEFGAQALARTVERLKSHLVKRRQFLLEQAELRALSGDGTPVAGRPEP
jgi:hypothetical protein